VIKKLWEVEIAHSIERGCVADVARAFTIIRWAYHGDLRPLAAAIRADSLHDAVLGFLADMIDKDRLQMVPRSSGHPKMPETFARDLVAASVYRAKDEGKGSDAAIERIAAVMGISSQIVKQAITRLRKHNSKQGKSFAI
jgi:hypothetical protein